MGEGGKEGEGRDTEYEEHIIVAVLVGVKDNIICKYFLLK